MAVASAGLVLLVLMLLGVMFPSGVAKPRLLGILAGTDQKDICSGMYMAGIAGVFAPRAVLSFLVGRPMKLGIMAGILQKDSYALGSGTYKAGIIGDCAAVFSSLVRRPMMLGIMAGLTQVNRGLEEYMENSVCWELTSYVSYSAR